MDAFLTAASTIGGLFWYKKFIISTASGRVQFALKLVKQAITAREYSTSNVIPENEKMHFVKHLLIIYTIKVDAQASTVCQMLSRWTQKSALLSENDLSLLAQILIKFTYLSMLFILLVN